jgi:hypothetical protein
MYAGAYVFGRTTQRTQVTDGRAREWSITDWQYWLCGHAELRCCPCSVEADSNTRLSFIDDPYQTIGNILENGIGSRRGRSVTDAFRQPSLCELRLGEPDRNRPQAAARSPAGSVLQQASARQGTFISVL